MKSLARLFAISAAALALTTAYAQDKPRVELKTNLGSMVIELEPAAAPNTVENFLAYVKSGHYEGTVFHRVIKGFMIQGGGFAADMKEKSSKAPIKNEAEMALKAGVKNDRGSIAMARTGDPHSATAQFFINVADSGFLNHTAPSGQGWGYCVFGKVVEGMDVVDKIKAVKTSTTGFHQNVPVDDVVIEKAEVA